MKPRIAIIGARRVHMGLGAFIAGMLHQSGAEVPAVVGTSEATVGESMRQLRTVYGIEALGYCDIRRLFDEVAVDAIVIASPYDTHLKYLESALESGKHVLCEKPLVWGGADDAADALRIWKAFMERKLLLMENVQWPYTLPAYDKLYPGVRGGHKPITALKFLLSPMASGVRMIIDSCSHVLSMLNVLETPREEALSSITITSPMSDRPAMALQWSYPGRKHNIVTTVHLERHDQPPRPAGYGLNGAFAHRFIDPESYRFSFHRHAPEEPCDPAGACQVPVHDPLRLLVRNFVKLVTSALTGESVFVDASIPIRMAHLTQLTDHCAKTFSDPMLGDRQ